MEFYQVGLCYTFEDEGAWLFMPYGWIKVAD